MTASGQPPVQRNISLTIAGRSHVLAVVPDEIEHVTMLAGMIDSRVARLGAAPGQTEARLMLIAALMLADELHAAQNGLPPPYPAPPPPPPPPPPPAKIAPEVLARVAAMAERIEKLATRLEQSGNQP